MSLTRNDTKFILYKTYSEGEKEFNVIKHLEYVKELNKNNIISYQAETDQDLSEDDNIEIVLKDDEMFKEWLDYKKENVSYVISKEYKGIQEWNAIVYKMSREITSDTNYIPVIKLDCGGANWLLNQHHAVPTKTYSQVISNSDNEGIYEYKGKLDGFLNDILDKCVKQRIFPFPYTVTDKESSCEHITYSVDISYDRDIDTRTEIKPLGEFIRSVTYRWRKLFRVYTKIVKVGLNYKMELVFVSAYNYPFSIDSAEVIETRQPQREYFMSAYNLETGGAFGWYIRNDQEESYFSSSCFVTKLSVDTAVEVAKDLDQSKSIAQQKLDVKKTYALLVKITEQEVYYFLKFKIGQSLRIGDKVYLIKKIRESDSRGGYEVNIELSDE